MTKTAACARLWIVGMLLLGFAAPAVAERAAWDQARVTALGKELAAATDDLYSSYIKIPPQVIGNRSQAGYALRSKLRLLKSQARSLSEAVKMDCSHSAHTVCGSAV